VVASLAVVLFVVSVRLYESDGGETGGTSGTGGFTVMEPQLAEPPSELVTETEPVPVPVVV
jgi:hypothetical protein